MMACSDMTRPLPPGTPDGRPPGRAAAEAGRGRGSSSCAQAPGSLDEDTAVRRLERAPEARAGAARRVGAPEAGLVEAAAADTTPAGVPWLLTVRERSPSRSS